MAVTMMVGKAYAVGPYSYGYSQGLAGGKSSAEDATSACEGYNSTTANNQCAQGYDIGFKKGCELEGDKIPFDPSPEYGQCKSS